MSDWLAIQILCDSKALCVVNSGSIRENSGERVNLCGKRRHPFAKPPSKLRNQDLVWNIHYIYIYSILRLRNGWWTSTFQGKPADSRRTIQKPWQQTSRVKGGLFLSSAIARKACTKALGSAWKSFLRISFWAGHCRTAFLLACQVWSQAQATCFRQKDVFAHHLSQKNWSRLCI